MLAGLVRGHESWAIHRRERAVLEAALAAHARGRLIDIGCGTKPYARFLRGRVSAHIGVDRADSIHGTAEIDVIGDALRTGLPAGSADTVLLSQVLEHVEDPAAAIAEAHRLLGPGGKLILSTNFAWHLHEAPRDFFRFSEFGLRHLFELAGFEVLELRPVAGTWLTIGEEVAYGLRRVASRHLAFAVLAIPLGHIAQAVGLLLERVSFDPALSSGHLIVGRKTSPQNESVKAGPGSRKPPGPVRVES